MLTSEVPEETVSVDHLPTGANMTSDQTETGLSAAELRDLRRLAGIMVPASAAYGVPGADDELIFADIVRSLGRDEASVKQVIALLRELSGGAFSELDQAKAASTAMALLGRKSSVVVALGRAVLQCYYRDDRVFRSLGLEPRPPFPRGHKLEPGDWSLLDKVKGRPRMWRDVDGKGA